MTKPRMILLFAMTVVLGCAETQTPTTSVLPVSAEPVANVQHALDAAFSHADVVLFRSWDGRWLGMDCDTDIELRPDGHAVLTEYGYAVRKYHGTYSTAAADGASELTLALDGYRGKWPTMSVYADASEILLIPVKGPMGFVFGNRGGATVPGDAGSFWPFRQIPIPTQHR